MSEQFYSTQNLIQLIIICKEYMNDKFDFKTEETNIKKVMYDIISIVNAEYKNKNISLKDLNIEALQRAKHYFIKKHNLRTRSTNPTQTAQAPQFAPTQTAQAPQFAPTQTAPVPQFAPTQTAPAPQFAPNQTSYVYQSQSPIDSSPNILQKPNIDKLISERDSELGISKFVPDISKLGKQINETAESSDDFMKKLQFLEEERKKVDESFKETNTFKETFKEEQSSINDDFKEKYLSIYSLNRDTSKYPFRYKYDVDIKEIENLMITEVIIADEMPPVPYLLLTINDIDNMCFANTEFDKKIFCKLIFDKTYKVSNGRIYTILKSIQDKRAPINIKNHISLSILKPDGELLNNNKDCYNISNITYVDKYLMITTDIYYEEGAFNINDYVVFIKSNNEYLNKSTGHQIKSLGNQNQNGFYNSFYILAPYNIDPYSGQYVLNTVLIKSMINLQSGNIINASTQNSLTIKCSLK